MDDWSKWLLASLGATWAAITAFIVAQLRSLSKVKANRDSTNARFVELKDQIKDLHSELHSHVKRNDQQHAQVGKAIAAQGRVLAVIESKLDMHIEEHQRDRRG